MIKKLKIPLSPSTRFLFIVIGFVAVGSDLVPFLTNQTEGSWFHFNWPLYMAIGLIFNNMKGVRILLVVILIFLLFMSVLYILKPVQTPPDSFIFRHLFRFLFEDYTIISIGHLIIYIGIFILTIMDSSKKHPEAGSEILDQEIDN